MGQIGIAGECKKKYGAAGHCQLLTIYWNIGRIIVEYEQQNQIRAEYGKQTLKELSRELTREFGKGFSVSNIQFMRCFYQSYPIQQTASVKLSWSHYCELLSWSVRELKRQIDGSLYERLLLSSGDANKEKVLSLAQKGIEINQPADSIRDPYVFEFLVCRKTSPCWKAIWKKRLSCKLRSFCWSWDAALRLSGPSSV